MSNPMLPMESLWAKNMGKYEVPPVPKADPNSITAIGGLPKITSDQLQTIGGSSESDSFGWMLLSMSALCGMGCSASFFCSYIFEGVNLYGVVPVFLSMSIMFGLMGSFEVKELNTDVDVLDDWPYKSSKILNEYNEALRKGS